MNMDLLVLDSNEQAADWCLRLAEGTLTREEQQQFDAWLADPQNRQRFEEVLIVWQGVEQAADRPEFIQARSLALESFRSANSRRWMRRLPMRWRGLLAAGLAALALIGFAVLGRGPTALYATGIGERRIAVLEDGSQLTLDAATRVKVHLAENRRELHLLSGRARFDVAKDPLRPFSVTAGNKLVVATGTSFSVELLERQMRVVLYEGRIEVLQQKSNRPLKIHTAQGAASTELTPGRELLTFVDRPEASVIPADIPRSLSWEAGQLNFVNEPLALAVERMNRYSREKLVLGDEEVAAFKVNGVFNAGDVQAFLEGVTSFFPVAVTREPGELILKSTIPKNNPGSAVPPRS